MNVECAHFGELLVSFLHLIKGSIPYLIQQRFTIFYIWNYDHQLWKKRRVKFIPTPEWLSSSAERRLDYLEHLKLGDHYMNVKHAMKDCYMFMLPTAAVIRVTGVMSPLITLHPGKIMLLC